MKIILKDIDLTEQQKFREDMFKLFKKYDFHLVWASKNEANLHDMRLSPDVVVFPSKETFLDDEFYEAEYKLQNNIRVILKVRDFTVEVYTGYRWLPVSEYVIGLIDFIKKGGDT